jgi:hypothetical protein
MSTNIILPALGESVTEGTVTRWLKKVGDSVAVDEPIVEISTDKVDTEVPSPVAGVLEEIFANEDDDLVHIHELPRHFFFVFLLQEGIKNCNIIEHVIIPSYFIEGGGIVVPRRGILPRSGGTCFYQPGLHARRIQAPRGA